MSPSKILFYLCISFIVGIFLGSVFKIPQEFIWGVFILGVLTVSISALSRGGNIFSFGLAVGLAGVKKYFCLCGFCLLFLVLGILRIQIAEFNILNDKLAKFNNIQNDVVLTGFVQDEPDLRENSQKLKVKIDKFESIVLVSVKRYPEYSYLDKIKITGKLKTPAETEDFSYKNYLMKDGIYSVIDFPAVEKLGKQNPNLWQQIYAGILQIKQKMRQSLQNNFLPPQNNILQGIVLGDKNALPQDLKNKLSIAGISHIIAVSGTHVVILTAILMSFLLAIRLSRGQAFYFSAVFICFYIVLVGLPASGVRAGIMGIIYLFAQKIGRQGASSRIIVLAGAIMLLQNPLLLIFDIGFQLSFLAVLGLILLEPLIRYFIKFLAKQFLNFKIEEKYDSIIMMFSATLAAQVFTLPVIVYNFGNISFVSPVVNILILPIVYYIMLFGFLSAVAGAIFSFLGWIFSVPCYFLLVYFVEVTNFFSKPWAFKTLQNVHWIWLFVSYLVISAGVRFFYKKTASVF